MDQKELLYQLKTRAKELKKLAEDNGFYLVGQELPESGTVAVIPVPTDVEITTDIGPVEIDPNTFATLIYVERFNTDDMILTHKEG